MSEQQNTQEIDVQALHARFAAITDMWQQAQAEIVELRAALKLRDAAEQGAQAAIQQLVQERDALQAQLNGDADEDEAEESED
jgi:hypothetical protein